MPSSGEAKLSMVDLQIVFAQPTELILNFKLSGKIKVVFNFLKDWCDLALRIKN